MNHRAFEGLLLGIIMGAVLTMIFNINSKPIEIFLWFLVALAIFVFPIMLLLDD